MKAPMGVEPKEEILTAQDIAAWFRISVPFVTKLVQKEVLPAFRLGYNLRFNKQEIKVKLLDLKAYKEPS